MTDRPTNEEREALIAGDALDALDADEAADLALLADLLADPSTWADPGPHLENSIVRAVLDAPAGADVEADIRSQPGPVRGRRRASRWPRRLPIAAGAAAFVVAIPFAVAGLTGGSNVDFNSRLSATALAPGASASADIVHNRAGFRVSLDAHGLPVLPAGEYYQAWLKNAAGTLVPIGSFSAGDGHITLWSGVSPADYPALSVTIEAADNNQASSGRRVLVGEVKPK
jgi:hypothetical protein